MTVAASRPYFLVITCRQPPGATPADVAYAVEHCYSPLIEAVASHPRAKICLHIYGSLLDRLARSHEALLLRIKALVQLNQIEILGGLFYGGPVALLPEHDVRGQIAMAGEFWESFIGSTPKGIYLPDLAWAPELPRLLEDTGLAYGFLARSQAKSALGGPFTGLLGRLERGGLPLHAFALEAALSAQFKPTQCASFVAGLLQAIQQQAVAPQAMGTGVALAAESFGLEPNTSVNGSTSFAALLAALGQTHQLDAALPLALFERAHAAQPIALSRSYAPLVPHGHALDDVDDWGAFPAYFPEIGTLYRRMLYASSRLRQAVERMEDEGRQAAWSDTLATAQRRVFAAQIPDAYGRGLYPGFADPSVRDATLGEICAAEAILGRIQEPDSATSISAHLDLDGDQTLDFFVTMPSHNVWLSPGRGGAIRTLEDRELGLDLLDAFGVAAGLEHHAPEVPRTAQGLVDWVVASNAPLTALAAGAGKPLADLAHPWEVCSSKTDQPNGDDGAFSLRMTAMVNLGPSEDGPSFRVDKKVGVPNGQLGLDLHYSFHCHSGATSLKDTVWALEVPLRYGAAQLLLEVDGVLLSSPDRQKEALTAQNVRKVRILGGAKIITLNISQPVQLCCQPRVIELVAPAGKRTVFAGLTLVLGHALATLTPLYVQLRAD